MHTLEEARKYQESHPSMIIIEREARYFAVVRGVRYRLVKDWELEQLDQKIWAEKETP